MYLLCIAALRGSHISNQRPVYMTAHICSDEGQGEKCLSFHTSFVSKSFANMEKFPFFLLCGVYGKEVRVLFHSVLFDVVWMLSLPPQRTLSQWEAQKQVIWSGKTALMYCPSSLFFPQLLSPLQCLQTQKCEQKKQSKTVIKVEYMSNLNLSICIQSLLWNTFCTGRISQIKARKIHEKKNN